MATTPLRSLAAAIVLTAVPLAGCEAANDAISAKDACADLVEMSLSELRAVQEGINNPERVERAYRDMAERFRAKAGEVDDAEVRRAAQQYAAKLQRLAEAVASGKRVDVDELVDANRRLAEACA